MYGNINGSTISWCSCVVYCFLAIYDCGSLCDPIVCGGKCEEACGANCPDACVKGGCPGVYGGVPNSNI